MTNRALPGLRRINEGVRGCDIVTETRDGDDICDIYESEEDETFRCLKRCDSCFCFFVVLPMKSGIQIV